MTVLFQPKAAASHPTYQAMIKAAITHLKETKGSSRAAILKYILQNYKVGDNVKLVSLLFHCSCFYRASKSAILTSCSLNTEQKLRLFF